MFNFGDLPANLRNIRSRVSFSDTGIYGNHKNTEDATSGRAGPVSLPPIKPSKSTSHLIQSSKSSSQVQLPKKLLPHHTIPQSHQNQASESKKLPTHREMLYLTLKHVPSARGLTFEQIYSFVTKAFEVPRSYTLESKLRKTLSNMTSKGIVTQNPGLEPRYVTYQLRQTEPEANLDLSVSGKSVPNVTAWPTSFSLPNGCDLLCRAGSVRRAAPPQLHHHRQHYRRNPMTVRLEPLTRISVGDPMICQSFGARAGLKFRDEQRPNSPSMDDEYEEAADSAECLNFYEKTWLSPSSDQSCREERGRPKCEQQALKSPPRMLNTYNSSDDPCETRQGMPHHSVNGMESHKAESQSCENPEHEFPSDGRFAAIRFPTSTTTPSWTEPKDSSSDSDPLNNFDIFANYNGETYSEYEMNNRSCHIMNDLGRSRALDEKQDDTTGQPEGNTNVVVNRMDYLLGIADIIDSYGEEPPELMRAGKRSRSTQKSKLSTFSNSKKI